MKNQSAFPWTADDGEKIQGEKGMTLRDYFAAQAMPRVMQDGKTFSEIANDAYLMADAMLKARKA